MKKNIKKHSKQPRELSGLPPQDHPESIEIHENGEFLTENQTPPDCSAVVPGHSGGVYGHGNVRYDALRPPAGLSTACEDGRQT